VTTNYGNYIFITVT